MSLHSNLSAIQSELTVPKGRENKFGGFKYRSCEDILDAVKPLLKKHNCVLTISDEIVMLGTRFYVKATATLSVVGSKDESISITALAREVETKTKMDEAQITGAASSYARKYALNGLFCIDETKDADTMENRKPSPPLEIDEKFGTVEEAKPKSIVQVPATAEQTDELDKLGAETGTDRKKLFTFFGVVNEVPTKEQAQKMIVSLRAKLSKQIDSAS